MTNFKTLKIAVKDRKQAERLKSMALSAGYQMNNKTILGVKISEYREGARVFCTYQDGLGSLFMEELNYLTTTEIQFKRHCQRLIHQSQKQHTA